MYIPPAFEESRIDVLQELVIRHPFGVLVTHGPKGLDANHLPFHLQRTDSGPGILHGHVARANPVWKELHDGDDVLVVFSIADAYISPNWYPSKHEFHRQVPTWNYIVVHAHGHVTLRHDPEFLRDVVTRLTQTHEATQPVPWQLTDSPPDFIETLLKSIVGLEIRLTRLIGKVKLSQNKPEADLRSAAAGLQSQGETVLSSAMLSHADRMAGGR